MKKFNLLRKSERTSVGTTLALTVGSPSVDRRYSALKHLTFMLLFLLGSLNVWGEDVTATYVFTSQQFAVTLDGVASTAWSATNGTSAQASASNYNADKGIQTTLATLVLNCPETYSNVSAVDVYYSTNASSTAKIKVTVGSEEASEQQVETSQTNKKMSFSFSDPGEDASLSITASRNGTSGSLYIKTVVIKYSSGGSTDPTITVKQEESVITELNFTTVGKGDAAPAAQTFTITGSNLTSDLSIASLTNFDYVVSPSGALSPTAGAVSATVTVTPKEGYTGTPGVKNETLTISGGGLASNVTIALKAEVKDKHDIIFDTDLKSIEKVSVMEGETYNISETIEAALIASCTYTKFEGWTTATSIADASVKPSLVSSVTMSTSDVTLKPVFSATTGGGGTSEETADVSIEDYASDNSWVDANKYTSVVLDENITATASGGSNSGKYYNNGKDWRFYQSESATLTISTAEGCTLKSATFTYGVKSSGELRDGTTVVASGSPYSISGTSKTFSVSGTGTSGQVKFTEISITYDKQGSGTTTYSLDPGCAAPDQCYAPTFSPSAGTFNTAQSVTLSCATDGATIYYSLDGTTPTSEYTGAIDITSTTTITAVAKKDGFSDSQEASATYTLKCATPSISPDGGTSNTGSQEVTLNCETEGATIYYSIDGSDPATEYTAPFTVTESASVKAIARKAGWTDSELASATFTINHPRTVTFHAVGTLSIAPETTITEATYGAKITLPSATPSSYCVAEGWTFAGWATSDGTTVAPTLLAGALYDCATTDLYAVYKNGDNKYHLVTTLPTGDDIPGKYMIVYTSGKLALEASTVSGKAYQLYGASIDNITDDAFADTEISNETYRAKSIWDVTFESNHWIFKNANTNKYLYGYVSSKYHNISIRDSKPTGFDVSLSNGYAVISSVDAEDVNVFYSTTDSKFEGTNGDTKNIHLYRLNNVYSSNPACCTDEVTIAVAAASNGSFTVKQGEESVIGSTLGTCTAAQTVTVECNPAAGYHVDDVTETIGTDVTITETSTNVYTITYNQNVTGTSTISVTFAETSDPSISVSTNTIALGSIAVGSAQTPTFTVEGANLMGAALTLSVVEGSKLSLDKTSLDLTAGAVGSTTITVTVNTANEVEIDEYITIADGATPTPNSTIIHVTANVQNQYTINWYNGETLLSESGAYLAGAEITSKPANPEPCDPSISFVGWLPNATIDGKQQSDPGVVATSAINTATANVTYYAVFAKVTNEEWREIFAAPTEGTYAICTGSYFLKAGISSNRFQNGSATPSITDGKLDATPAADCQWEISINDAGKFLIKNSTNYAGGTTSKNQGALLTDATNTHAQWEISYNSGFVVKNVGRAADSSDPGNAYLRQNGNNGWATYASGTGTAPRFFKHIPASTKDYMTTCAVTFDATYQAGTGEGEDYIESNIAKINYTVLGNDVTNFTKAGYKFAGWKENGTDRAAGDVYATVSGDLTFIAQWEEKADPEISFASSSCSVTYNGTVVEPVFTNPYGVSVTFSSANESIATVGADGEVTLQPNATGSVVITATAGETDDYKAASVSYTLNIEDDLSGTWNLVTAAADLIPGMKVIIANVADGSSVMTMGAQNGNNRTAVSSTVAGNVLTPAEGTKVFTLVYAGDGKFAFQASTKYYLYAASSGSNYLKEQATNNANGEWTISISEGVATIKAQGSSTHNWIQYNGSGSNNLFSSYLNAQSDVVLYAKQFDYTRETTQGRFGTICLPNGGKMEGASIYEVAYYGQTSQKIFFDEILNGEMEAGMPYIFLPNEGATKLGVYYTDAANVEAGHHNGLYGSYTQEELATDGSCYILLNNQYCQVVEALTYVGANRAYIKLGEITPKEPALAPGRRRISMNVNDTQTATGIDQVPSDQVPSTKVLINGELFILRGKKMYDAQGHLVK